MKFERNSVFASTPAKGSSLHNIVIGVNKLFDEKGKENAF